MVVLLRHEIAATRVAGETRRVEVLVFVFHMVRVNEFKTVSAFVDVKSVVVALAVWLILVVVKEFSVWQFAFAYGTSEAFRVVVLAKGCDERFMLCDMLIAASTNHFREKSIDASYTLFH